MSSRNTVTTMAGIKLGIFTLVSVVVTTVLAMIMGNFGFGSTTQYKAVFSSASLLSKGDDVRVAGLVVGSVKNVQIHDRNHALVTFAVKSDVPLTTASHADIRFLNLVGDRYLALSQGEPGAARLPAHATIPMSRTTPALDLTALFNGFQPLFTALDPKEINDLSLNLVKVLQGEGGTIQSLLARTASLTNSLADRDQLIGQVITNLSGMLQTVDAHHQQLDTLVVQLKDWMTNLSRDRNVIGQSVQNVSTLADELATLLVQSRPAIKGDVHQIHRLAAIMKKPESKAIVNEALARLPDMFRKQVRIGSYGSWYNYYLCDFDGQIILPKLSTLTGVLGVSSVGAALDKLGITRALYDQIQSKLNSLSFHSTAARCD
ncbi:MCE family protein [Nocardioides pocheonensis]|uniref:MCE family protein n=1 Tax=Nocardioides pocheonensis TaxID=661485 RepID=A0A3N0GUI5_9ACTN|nr:MlaD family protein [Nocardioides pocheonensis]RNM16124.1 MCE family protein [Nocardioides pocheonensis]